VLEPYRGRGIGKALVSEWEAQMKSAGYSMVLTSTLANETSQYFYRKLEYIDTGALLLPEEPSLEIILRKTLK
jgi:ribosomal protein S18 acetylase RimI-like enzyme